jgi:UDP-3-O-[3-hydroxymyristoyl] glucosamine N-acyltransferase
MPELSLADLAVIVGGELRGPGERMVRGVAPLDAAGPEELSFVANPRYLPYLQGAQAGAVLVPPELRERIPPEMAAVVVEDPHLALYRLLPLLYPRAEREAVIHPTAILDPTATIGAGVSVGPYAVIEAGVRLADGCSIGAHVVVGRGCAVGEGSVIHPQATLYPGAVVGRRCVVHSGARVGKEGFGFVWHEGGHRRVEQVGKCVLEDDVEIGCNSTVDRGSIGDTVVGAGTKIDNLVHLGHNVRTGRHVIVIAQVGVSGSTSIGDGAVLAGLAGVGGHLDIGAGARVGAQAGVTADIPAGATYSGYPARPHREAMRAQAALFKLPDLMRRIRELEKVVQQGETGDGPGSSEQP